ncbi:USP domain-containing protein [Haematococcus lacustris]|uniref:USP domain-containing protein n=1 Tax=Haematococcus lacustris TaxID=44745 RepID=A0A699YNA5_HAELA|nr:USP domain-containing protein [Haematococcus lacustris]
MLRRESLLTKAKLHVLLWEHINQDKQLRTWKLQLKQGEPEFERLKRELDEVKHSHRGLDGTYRSQAEMDRHRAQLADAAIEEQLEVQTAFREQGALLQAIYDSKLRAEHEMLQGWKGTVENLLDKFLELMAAKGQGDVAALTPTLPAPGAAPGAAAEDKPGSAVEADASAEACVRAVEQGPGGKREEQEGAAAAGDRWH